MISLVPKLNALGIRDLPAAENWRNSGDTQGGGGGAPVTPAVAVAEVVESVVAHTATTKVVVFAVKLFMRQTEHGLARQWWLLVVRIGELRRAMSAISDSAFVRHPLNQLFADIASV